MQFNVPMNAESFVSRPTFHKFLSNCHLCSLFTVCGFSSIITDQIQSVRKIRIVSGPRRSCQKLYKDLHRYNVVPSLFVYSYASNFGSFCRSSLCGATNFRSSCSYKAPRVQHLTPFAVVLKGVFLFFCHPSIIHGCQNDLLGGR